MEATLQLQLYAMTNRHTPHTRIRDVDPWINVRPYFWPLINPFRCPEPRRLDLGEWKKSSQTCPRHTLKMGTIRISNYLRPTRPRQRVTMLPRHGHLDQNNGEALEVCSNSLNSKFGIMWKFLGVVNRRECLRGWPTGQRLLFLADRYSIDSYTKLIAWGIWYRPVWGCRIVTKNKFTLSSCELLLRLFINWGRYLSTKRLDCRSYTEHCNYS